MCILNFDNLPYLQLFYNYFKIIQIVVLIELRILFLLEIKVFPSFFLFGENTGCFFLNFIEHMLEEGVKNQSKLKLYCFFLDA